MCANSHGNPAAAMAVGAACLRAGSNRPATSIPALMMLRMQFMYRRMHKSTKTPHGSLLVCAEFVNVEAWPCFDALFRSFMVSERCNVAGMTNHASVSQDCSLFGPSCCCCLLSSVLCRNSAAQFIRWFLCWQDVANARLHQLLHRKIGCRSLSVLVAGRVVRCECETSIARLPSVRTTSLYAETRALRLRSYHVFTLFNNSC